MLPAGRIMSVRELRDLRDLCNRNGISCKDNGIYLPQSKLVSKLREKNDEKGFQMGGGKKNIPPYNAKLTNSTHSITLSKLDLS